jgi:hypothetical protein
MTSASLDEILEPSYVTDLTTLPFEELRSRRELANEVETGMSYLRRLLQGRLDIVNAESSRRASGEVAGDLHDLVDRLPAILGDHVHAPGFGRLPTLLAPGDIEAGLQTRLDAIVSPARLADLPDAPDDELASIARALGDFEREVSGTRKAVQVVEDRIKEEIVRRYRSGEATVDALLS